MGLDELAGSMGINPERARRKAREKVANDLRKAELERDEFEDSMLPSSTTFLVRIPRISSKSARDPRRRAAVLPEAARTVRMLKAMLALAQETLSMASEPVDILEDGPEDEVVDLTGKEPRRISPRSS
jgi:hypothetical protein